MDKPRYVWLNTRWNRLRAQICRDPNGCLVLVTDGCARYSIIDITTGDCTDPRGYGAKLSRAGRRTIQAMLVPEGDR